MEPNPNTSRLSGDDAQEAWQRLADLLLGEDAQQSLNRVYPAPPLGGDELPLNLSFCQALADESVAATVAYQKQGQQLHESITKLLKQLSVFENVGRCPVLAITGLLNAGKSSLLASYLSPANRGRVLTGLSNDSGTHRFVLWMPKIWWEDSELLSTLFSFVSEVFGYAPEHLSDDPEIAALQYNGRIRPEKILDLQHPASDSENNVPEAPLRHGNDSLAPPASDTVNPMDVPLIAYDDALDELRLGLVDCPDIQTGFQSIATVQRGAEMAILRQEHLRKIGRLCSAFIVVSKMSSLHDDGLLAILQTLRDAMPGVPRLLAVNKVKARYSPGVVYEQTRGLLDRFSIRSVYVAYDFRSHRADTRIPAPPERMQPSLDKTPMPIFFQATEEIRDSSDLSSVHEAPSDKTAPGALATSSEDSQALHPSNYLHDLSSELDIGNLTRESSRSLKLQLKAQASQAYDWLVRNQEAKATQRKDAWQALADACYEFMAERDSTGSASGLRLQASPTIVAQMADSLQRTAPAWMRLSLKIDKTARQLQQAVANSASRFKILQSASESVAGFAKKFKRGEGAQVVTPERLAKAVRSCDIHDAFARSKIQELQSGCELAIRRFAAEDKTELDQQELDRWSRQVWEQMSFREKLWKGTQPLAVMMAPLLAAILVPIDGGGSAVLVFASTKELLAAAGLAAVMTPMATGGEALRIVHRETPWRQLSDLFAILCDSIGVPRPESTDLPYSLCAGARRQLLPSQLETKAAANRSALVQWQIDASMLKEFQLRTQRLI